MKEFEITFELFGKKYISKAVSAISEDQAIEKVKKSIVAKVNVIKSTEVNKPLFEDDLFKKMQEFFSSL